MLPNSCISGSHGFLSAFLLLLVPRTVLWTPLAILFLGYVFDNPVGRADLCC